MTDAAIIEAYFQKNQPYKEGILKLREIVKTTELEETLKWGAPIYTINNKNVIGILAFKNHFGLWFYHGALLKDPNQVLKNAQEGKTKFMRHWIFNDIADINKDFILAYINEAILLQKKNLIPKTQRTKKNKIVEVPEMLREALKHNLKAKRIFDTLSPYIQKEYCEYIATAKQEKTKQSRLKKSLDLIADGKGLNDAYRK